MARPLQQDRRSRPRSRVSTNVYIHVDGMLHRCRASNVSTTGVFIEGNRHALERGRILSLVVPVPVHGVIKLHRRRVEVAHASERGVGLKVAVSPRPPALSVLD